MAKQKVATKVKVAKKPKVTGFAPMKFKDMTITQKNSGRFEVVTAKGANINGAEKVKLLIEAKVLKGSFKKATAEETPAAT